MPSDDELLRRLRDDADSVKKEDLEKALPPGIPAHLDLVGHIESVMKVSDLGSSKHMLDAKEGTRRALLEEYYAAKHGERPMNPARVLQDSLEKTGEARVRRESYVYKCTACLATFTRGEKKRWWKLPRAATCPNCGCSSFSLGL